MDNRDPVVQLRLKLFLIEGRVDTDPPDPAQFAEQPQEFALPTANLYHHLATKVVTGDQILCQLSMKATEGWRVTLGARVLDRIINQLRIEAHVAYELAIRALAQLNLARRIISRLFVGAQINDTVNWNLPHLVEDGYRSLAAARAPLPLRHIEVCGLDHCSLNVEISSSL